MQVNKPVIISFDMITKAKRNQIRIDECKTKIVLHQVNIEKMREMASKTKNPKEREAIAKEIGYSVLEIENHLNPLIERLENAVF